MRRFLAAAAVFFLSSCSVHRPLQRAESFPPLRLLAVLPLDNETIDLDGPPAVRKELARGLSRRGYRLLPTAEVDRVLKEDFGITDGGQLGSVRPQALADALGADGLVYGTLQRFEYLNFGFFLKREVAARVRLLEGASGKVVWEDERSYARRRITLKKKKAKKIFVRGTVRRQLEKALHVPLQGEIRRLVRRLLRTLPRSRRP